MAEYQWINRETCVAAIEGREDDGPYSYVPSLAAGIVFCVLFGISLILHTFTSIRYRMWWQIVFAVGALGKSCCGKTGYFKY